MLTLYCVSPIILIAQLRQRGGASKRLPKVAARQLAQIMSSDYEPAAGEFDSTLRAASAEEGPPFSVGSCGKS